MYENSINTLGLIVGANHKTLLEYILSIDQEIPIILPGIGESYAIGTFRCADGYVSFLPLGARMWPNIARMIGRDDLITHPDYLDSEKRLENRKSLETIFQSRLDQHTRKEIFMILN